MEKKEFEIKMFGKDIFIISDDITYTTLGNGMHEGLQTNSTNSVLNNHIKTICANIHLNMRELMKCLKQIDNG